MSVPVTNLTDSDIGRIAMKLLVLTIAEDDHSFTQVTNRRAMKGKFPQLSKEVGEKMEGLEQFYAHILPEIIRNRLGCSGVKLDWKNTPRA